MKKLILSFVIVLTGVMASAQTSKGNFIVGGNINIGSYKSSTMEPLNNPNNGSRENKYNTYGIYPGVGYFIMDKFAIGLSFGLNNTQQTYKTTYPGGIEESNYKNNSTTINLYARKYFLNDKNFGFYTGLRIGAGPSSGSTKYKYLNNPETSYKSNGMNTNVGLDFGLAYFPTPHIGLQAGVAGFGWSKSKGTTIDNTTSGESKFDNSSLDFNVNSLALSIGVYYIFGFKK